MIGNTRNGGARRLLHKNRGRRGSLYNKARGPQIGGVPKKRPRATDGGTKSRVPGGGRGSLQHMQTSAIGRSPSAVRNSSKENAKTARNDGVSARSVGKPSDASKPRFGRVLGADRAAHTSRKKSNETFTTDQLATRWGYSRKTIVRWLGSGKLPFGERPVQHWRLNSSDVIAFEREHPDLVKQGHENEQSKGREGRLNRPNPRRK
jgi:hypothetical protein